MESGFRGGGCADLAQAKTYYVRQPAARQPLAGFLLDITDADLAAEVIGLGDFQRQPGKPLDQCAQCIGR